MHANTATHASSDLDLIACMHADTHASIRAARLPVDSVAPQRRFTRRRHTCRWQKGQAARTLASICRGIGSRRTAAARFSCGRQAAANAEHAEGGGRQPPTQSTQSTLASIHVHTLMIASVHARTESRSTPFARVPTSSPPAI